MTANSKQHFNQLYSDVASSLASAMQEMETLDVDHEDGKQEIGKIRQQLSQIQDRFNDELSFLEKHAEWDKFTMAFFGETNAGKSTVIESLRILFNEDLRRQQLEHNAQNLQQAEQALAAQADEIRSGMGAVYAAYASEVASLQQSIASLRQIAEQESSARIRRRAWLWAIGGVLLGAAAASGTWLLAGA